MLTKVKGEKLEDEEEKRGGVRHIIFSMMVIIVLVKIKNWMVVEYIKWMFDNKADDFLSRIKSRNYVECNRTKGALWKDCRNFCKSKGGGKGKTIYKYYGENFDDYFKKIDRESHVIAQVKGCGWEKAALLRLKKISEQNPFQNYPKINEIKTAATTADESGDDGGSVISNLESRIDTVTFPHVGRQETINERERMPTRNLSEAHKISDERNKSSHHLEHQALSDDSGEKSDVEDFPRENHCVIKQEVISSIVEESELKEDDTKARKIKMAWDIRRNNKRKPCSQRTKEKRNKRFGYKRTWFEGNIRSLKWWTMRELNQSYSCAANRYAKFKSNRRFKPGD